MVSGGIACALSIPIASAPGDFEKDPAGQRSQASICDPLLADTCNPRRIRHEITLANASEGSRQKQKD